MGKTGFRDFLALGLTIGIGFAVAGIWIGNSIVTFKQMNRSVTVKGLSERIVDADLVLWPIAFSVTGKSLAEVQNKA